jgi:hypothetical protein
MVLGSQYTPKDGHRLSIEDFTELEDDEVFFAVFPNIGNGDYTFKLSPELMMDFDMRENPIVLDTVLDTVNIYKIRKFRRDDYEPEIVYDAKCWDGGMKNNGKTMDIEDIPKKKGEKIMCWDVDDHSPLLKEEIISWLERTRNK